jgi:hypothetical protein
MKKVLIGIGTLALITILAAGSYSMGARPKNDLPNILEQIVVLEEQNDNLYALTLMQIFYNQKGEEALMNFIDNNLDRKMVEIFYTLYKEYPKTFVYYLTNPELVGRLEKEWEAWGKKSAALETRDEKLAKLLTKYKKYNARLKDAYLKLLHGKPPVENMGETLDTRLATLKEITKYFVSQDVLFDPKEADKLHTEDMERVLNILLTKPGE